MKVLLTGGTGFLGKRVLAKLVALEEVTQIFAVARGKTSHPSPKVQVIHADLSSPAFVNELEAPVDAVIHLAGLYDFSKPYAANYEANVLGTLHLLEALKKFAPTRILFASTYAVGIGSDELQEERLQELPPREHAYSHTKALAEALLESSPHSCDIYRLGILIGDSRSGSIDKVDGPYSFYRLMRQASTLLAPLRRAPLPVPAQPDAPLPLVAVDEAAEIFVQGLLSPVAGDRVRYFGAYRTDTVRFDEWLQACTEHLATTGCRLVPVYTSGESTRILQLAERLTQVPAETIHFAQLRTVLRNEKFLSRHGAESLSPWSSLGTAFLRGGDSA
jgi:nucleoside-diphosphate-sugar epimerase